LASLRERFECPRRSDDAQKTLKRVEAEDEAAAKRVA
jgi:hypothetical protein